MKGQLLNKSRTKRAARPVTRYQPPVELFKPKIRPPGPTDEERRKRRKKKLRKQEKKRRAEKRRRRELTLKVFSSPSGPDIET